MAKQTQYPITASIQTTNYDEKNGEAVSVDIMLSTAARSKKTGKAMPFVIDYLWNVPIDEYQDLVSGVNPTLREGLEFVVDDSELTELDPRA